MEDAAFSRVGDTAAPAASAAQNGYVTLNREDVVPSPYNEGLKMENIDAYVKSIRESGILEPITVYEREDGKYEILSGHQRFHAWCDILGNPTIKAILRPYEKDPVKRFMAHTQANTLQRDKNLAFWCTRIDIAGKVLDETGFSGSEMERKEKISSMLGISQMQLYRYEGFKSLIPELQELQSDGVLSANTLYNAISLSVPQQKQVCREVRRLQKKRVEAAEAEKNGDTEYAKEITRNEFVQLVKSVKNGNTTKKASRELVRSTYIGRVDHSYSSLLKAIGKAKSKEDRSAAVEFIRRARAELDALESELSGTT